MSDFAPALRVVLEHEGGYSNDPSDAGGETKYGISKRAHPNVDIANLTEQGAASIYYCDYWEPNSFQRITSQAIATKAFDLTVNMGSKQAIRIVQLACCDSDHPVVCDGIIGTVTLDAINACDPPTLLTNIRTSAREFYQELAVKKPSNARFLGGWLARADA